MIKDKFIKIAVTKIEDRIIRKKAADLGIKVAEFIRGMAMEYNITHKLTESEVECYILLVKFSDNFRVIFDLYEKGDPDGAWKEAMDISTQIREHLKKFK